MFRDIVTMLSIIMLVGGADVCVCVSTLTSAQITDMYILLKSCKEHITKFRREPLIKCNVKHDSHIQNDEEKRYSYICDAAKKM